MIYLLDSNTISDMIFQHRQVSLHVAVSLAKQDTLGLCQPIRYELLRGLYWRNVTGKLRVFNTEILPLLTWLDLEDGDWEQAARFWSDARQKGRHLGDPDLLLAGLAYRLNATIVSNDSDFDPLPVRPEDWRMQD